MRRAFPWNDSASHLLPGINIPAAPGSGSRVVPLICGGAGSGEIRAEITKRDRAAVAAGEEQELQIGVGASAVTSRGDLSALSLILTPGSSLGQSRGSAGAAGIVPKGLCRIKGSRDGLGWKRL